MRPPARHRADQGFGARGNFHFRQSFFDHLGVMARQFGDAFAQSRFKFQFTRHRAGGDRRDVFAQAQFGGHFIEGFAGQDRRIHVGDQQFPPSILGHVLNAKIDRLFLEHIPDRRDQRGVGMFAVAGDLSRLALGQPSGFANLGLDRPQRVGGERDVVRGQHALRRDKSDDAHGLRHTRLHAR